MDMVALDRFLSSNFDIVPPFLFHECSILNPYATDNGSIKGLDSTGTYFLPSSRHKERKGKETSMRWKEHVEGKRRK
jgi:hypothetical protein